MKNVAYPGCTLADASTKTHSKEMFRNAETLGVLCRDSGRESNTILTVELFVRLEMISVRVYVCVCVNVYVHIFIYFYFMNYFYLRAHGTFFLYEMVSFLFFAIVIPA